MFYYEVSYWDEVDEKQTIEKGFLGKDGYAAAAERLKEYYGSTHVFWMKLEELNDVTTFDEMKEIIKSGQ